MTFRIESRIGVRATAQDIWEIIADLPDWDRWNPVETGVQGALGFGAQLTLTERVPGLPERTVQATVAEWQPDAQLVWTEKRGWLFNAMRYYEIEELTPGSCIVANGLILSGLRGESHHARHRRTLKAAFGEISEAIRRRAEG